MEQICIAPLFITMISLHKYHLWTLSKALIVYACGHSKFGEKFLTLKKATNFMMNAPRIKSRKPPPQNPRISTRGTVSFGLFCPLDREYIDHISGFDVNKKLEEIFFEIQRLDSTVRTFRRVSVRGYRNFSDNRLFSATS